MTSSPTSDDIIPLLVSPSPSRPTTPATLSNTDVFSFGSSLKSPSPVDTVSVSSSSTDTTVIMSGNSQDDPMIIDSDNENEEDTKTFHYFSKLPLQVRCKIWSLNLPGPRLVEIIFKENDEAWYTNAPIITNLSTCRESRLEALKSYPLSFACFDAKAMVPFNFALDTLFLGRNLKHTHAFFKKYIIGDDLAKVKFLMVDAYLNWGKRTKNDRGMGNLGTMSRLVFSGVKEHTVLYSTGVDPLPHWADWRWFPRMESSRIKHADMGRAVARVKELWPFIHGRIRLPKHQAEYYRYGAIGLEEKYEPAIRLWKIPEVYTLGLAREVMDSYNYSSRSCWPQLLMDRVIEDIFT